MIKTITKSAMSGRSSDGKSKSPRSNRGSARESTPGRYDRDPEVALEQLIAEAGDGSRPDPLPINVGRFCRIGSNDAEFSDVVDAANLRTSRGKRDRSQHRGKDHENMVDIGETEEQQDVVKRVKAGCPECIEREKQKVLDNTLNEELPNRLVLACNQATHLIDNARLLERQIEEKERELAQTMRVGEALTDDLRLKLDEQSDKSCRLEEDFDGSRRELRSCQNDLLIAEEQIENLGRTQQYQDEHFRASHVDLENKVNVACMEDDTGKVQLSVDLRGSVRAFGELQGELTNKVRQLDLIQTEVKWITDSRDAVVVEQEKLEHQAIQYQNELQGVNGMNTITEKNNVPLSKDNLALGYNADSKENNCSCEEGCLTT